MRGGSKTQIREEEEEEEEEEENVRQFKALTRNEQGTLSVPYLRISPHPLCRENPLQKKPQKMAARAKVRTVGLLQDQQN
jgi:hypothetical protein